MSDHPKKGGGESVLGPLFGGSIEGGILEDARNFTGALIPGADSELKGKLGGGKTEAKGKKPAAGGGGSHAAH